VRRALVPADRAFRALAGGPALVATWWASTLPLLGSVYGLVQRALEHGIPDEAGELLLLLLWSCLVVLAWAWYLLGIIFLHQQARAQLEGRPIPPLPPPRRLLDRFPATAGAHAARTGLTLLALLPIGLALPVARVTTASWPARAIFGLPRTEPGSRWPSLQVTVVQLTSWLLLAVLTCNLVVLAGWLTHGSLLDAPALLPQLSDPRLWALSALLSLSLVEPWRAIALLHTLRLERQDSEDEVDGQHQEPAPC